MKSSKSYKNFHFTVLLAGTIILAAFTIMNPISRNTFSKTYARVLPNPTTSAAVVRACVTDKDCFDTAKGKPICLESSRGTTGSYRCGCVNRSCLWSKK